MAQQVHHIVRGLNEDKLIVVFADDGSLCRHWHVIVQHELLADLDWLVYVWLVKVDPYPNSELTPTRLVDFIRRLGQNNMRHVTKRLVQSEFNFGDVGRRLGRAHITAPLVSLVLLAGLWQVNGMCTHNQRLVDDSSAVLHLSLVSVVQVMNLRRLESGLVGVHFSGN